LIDFLAGEIQLENLTMKKDNWYKTNEINLLLYDQVLDIDVESKLVRTSSGKSLKYDRLLLATGANAFVPPIPGSDKPGVFSVRRISDALAIKEYCSNKKMKIVIIGGGVLGLEVGNALRKGGHDITVIEAMPRLLPRQVDHEGSEILQKQLESMGFKFHIGQMTKEIIGSEQVTDIALDSGVKIDCDIAIISAGIRADLDLATKLGLKIDKGIVVNDYMSTSIPDIYSAGDGINHNGRLYGIWPASEAQGRIAGINMTGGNEKYKGTTMSNVLKVVGIDLVSMGDIDADNNYESIVQKDQNKFIYKKLILNDNKIIGAILYGDKKDWLKIKRAIEKEIEISRIKDDLKAWNFANL
jgi:nitrite reductase (NADH) large subunit